MCEVALLIAANSMGGADLRRLFQAKKEIKKGEKKLAKKLKKTAKKVLKKSKTVLNKAGEVAKKGKDFAEDVADDVCGDLLPGVTRQAVPICVRGAASNSFPCPFCTNTALFAQCAQPPCPNLIDASMTFHDAVHFYKMPKPHGLV